MSASDVNAQGSAAISLADEDEVKKVLLNSVLGLWDVVNNLTRLKPTKRDRYRVTIFGSARAKPGTVAYEETKRAAKALAAIPGDGPASTLMARIDSFRSQPPAAGWDGAWYLEQK